MTRRRKASSGAGTQVTAMRKGELSMVVQMVLWGALIVIVTYLVYAFIIKGGTGPLPGENLLG